MHPSKADVKFAGSHPEKQEKNLLIQGFKVHYSTSVQRSRVLLRAAVLTISHGLTSAMPKNTEKEPKNFEAAMAELDVLVERMESGDLPLDESLTAYQRGTALLAYCQKILSDAQSRVQVLEGGAEGSLKDLPE